MAICAPQVDEGELNEEIEIIPLVTHSEALEALLKRHLYEEEQDKSCTRLH